MTKEIIFSDEAIQNFTELGAVLRRIHNRLVKEGRVKVVNGKAIFLDNKRRNDVSVISSENSKI